jgi:hypothetical protein
VSVGGVFAKWPPQVICLVVQKGGRPVQLSESNRPNRRRTRGRSSFRALRDHHEALSRSRGLVTIQQAYSVLGLDASSTTPDEVRLRFRELVRSNHPDGKPSYEQARANETTRLIVEACTLLRTQGFPRGMARSRSAAASGLRYQRQAAAEPQSADLFVWIDELWRECVCGDLVCVVSPAFGVRLTLGSWTLGWEIMWKIIWSDHSNFVRSTQEKLG